MNNNDFFLSISFYFVIFNYQSCQLQAKVFFIKIILYRNLPLLESKI